jgi:ribonuclease P protein component
MADRPASPVAHRHRAPGSEGLARGEKVRRRAEFLRCYREGRRRGGRLATLFFVPNALSHPRLGITASRKVGGAVVRQRLKRRVREIYRRWQQRSRLPALDLVFNLKPAAAQADFAELRRELERQLGSVLPGGGARRRSEGERRGGRGSRRRRRHPGAGEAVESWAPPARGAPA